MATGKRFYWIKLKETFMTSDTVDYLMSMPDGANYVVLYQMLCLKTINTGGRLSRQIGEIIIPYNIDKIQRDCKWFSMDTIRVALELFKSFGLIYEDVDGTLVLSEHENLVGSETDYAEQKRKQRLPSVDNVHQLVQQNVHTENRERDKEIREKRLDTRQKREEEPFASPELTEVESFARERGSNVDPKRFFQYYEENNWMDGKGKPVRDWKKKFISWEGYEKRKPPQERKFPDWDDAKAIEQIERLRKKMEAQSGG